MPKPRTNAGWLVATLMVIAFPVGYMGAYYAMLEPEPKLKLAYDPFDYYAADYVPVYRADGERIGRFFWLAHRLDRRFRPSHWGD